MARRINQERCIQCGTCLDECPNGGIREENGLYSIESGLCTECFGLHTSARCAEVCPVEAIESDETEELDEDLLVGRSAHLHPERFPRD
ncbi:MAG: 4Fe-4S binding protein [Chthonomonadales bacterium]|nr:4Fe-4S binding protein [Chthonomonadales bacterium]